MVQGNGFVQSVYDNSAILAFAQVTVNLLAQFIAYDPIQIITQGTQQSFAI